MAYCLGMPVYKILEEMPHSELNGWFDYFKMRPYGWREDDRAYKYIQTQGYKDPPGALFSSLTPIYNREKEDKEGVNINSLKNSILYSKMLSSTGGKVFKE